MIYLVKEVKAKGQHSVIGVADLNLITKLILSTICWVVTARKPEPGWLLSVLCP
jgi:hypothetical protein